MGCIQGNSTSNVGHTHAEQQLTRRSKLRTILESLRATASEEERSRLIDNLEEILL
jgi:hypothetical protein